jgi:Secretion system C-terminal sorting domain
MKNLYKLFLALFFSTAFWGKTAHAQSISEQVIPNDVNRINLKVQGASGGSVGIDGRIVFSSTIYSCIKEGGYGAIIEASFAVGNLANQIPANSTLRFIRGIKPGHEYIETYFGIATKGNAGGGGSAVLYKAPSSSTWVILVVAGGGGGAYGEMAAYTCFGKDGFAANKDGENGWDGGSASFVGIGLGLNGIGGQNGNGGGGGGINQSISGGGGGAFTDGSSNLLCVNGLSAAGKKGFPNGGSTAACYSQFTGGFGSGGQGLDAGGGGGGYSGGGGGASYRAGGGGGSYVNNFALISNSKVTSFNTDDGIGRVQYGYVYTACAGHTLNSGVGNVTNVSCKGGNNGAATVNYTTTHPANTTFEWFPLSVTGQGTNSINNLSAGTYYCKVKLTNAATGSTCDSALHTIIITEPTTLTSITDSISNAKCNGANNGYVRIKVAGGTKPYNATMGVVNNTDSTIVINNLAAGNYTTTITDAKGCTKLQSFTIGQPGSITQNRLYVNKNATGANSGESWANAFTDLQLALNTQKNCPNIIQIWVAKGIYYPTTSNDRTKTFLVNNSVALYGGFAGNETLITARNLGQNNTILSGNIGNANNSNDNSYHVIVINGANNTSTIDGFIIQDGYNGFASPTDNLGAGLYQYNSISSKNTTYIYNCVFRNNFSKMGAAICNDDRASDDSINQSKMFVQNCLMYNNNIPAGNFGAAIANLNNNINYNNISIINNTITQNRDGANYIQIYNNALSFFNVLNSIVLGPKNYNAISGGITVKNSNITTATGIVNTPNLFANIIEDRPFVNTANPAGLDGKLMTSDDGFALQGCSNGINGGNNSYLIGSDINDFTGNPRRYNYGIVDIGAYELQGTAAVADAVLFVNASAPAGGDGATWATAFNSLQYALTLAASCIDVKEIWVAAGTYTPSNTDATKSFAMVSNVKIYGGFAGTEATVAERDWVNNRSILSGEIGTTSLTDNCYHVIKNTNVSNAVLNGFSIERGYAFAGGINNFGGGIYNSGVSGNTFFENLYFNLNRANGGGAIYNTTSPVKIINCVFDANGAFNFGSGGAIYNASSRAIIHNCVFNANTADAGAGAVQNISSDVDIYYSTFYKNQTSTPTKASGIENDASNVTIVNTIMWDTVGGANIVNINAGAATVSNSNIQKNGAAYTGFSNTNINPIFNDPANGNGNDNKWFTIDDGLHLRKCNSTLVNAGSNTTGITTDIIGAVRIQGTASAMGAYETEILPYQLYPNTSNRLYVKPTGSPTNDGLAWSSALTELGEAIRIATQNTQIKEIWVAAGTYKPIYDEFYNACGGNAKDKTFLIPNGVKLYGGFAGTENNIIQTNPTANPTILSGDIGVVNNQLDNVYHVVSINNPSAVTELNGFTVTKGQGEFTGNNINFLNLGLSTWQANGAGVFINQGGANVKITNCNITFNEGDPNTLGGGIFSNNGSPIIENTRIQSNLAGNGAGCYITGGGPLFNKVIFASNSVYTNGIGGAINTFNDSNTVINKSVFDNNVATTGGAIYRNTNGPLNITNTIFNNNYSSAEGAVLYQGSGTTNFTNCTVTPNTTTTGSTFWVASSGLNLVNNIVYYTGTIPPLFNNNTSANFTVNNSNIKSNQPLNGNNNINANPLFVNSNNPAGTDGIWFTADDGLQLPCNSPSVNTGTNTNAPLDDVLGNSFIGGNKDMGAYESKATVPTAPTPTSFGATQIQTGTTQYGDCSNFIATVTSSGSTPIAGSTSAKVWVEFIQNNGYVKRHYEITPANFASFYTGTVTLYFTQQEFDDFNAVNAVKLPTNGNDAVGKANLLIEKRGGFSNNGTGLPSSYTGTISTIDPVDANIVWNTTFSRWEVTFDVTGFSGFFVKTQTVVLPVKWLSISGNVSADKKAIINFKVEEYNVAKYDVEKSTNGADFISIGTLISKGNGINNYDFTENINLSGVAYYRIKQIDNNGKIEYSTIIKLSNKENISFTVYPNPTTGNLFIRTNGLHKKAMLTDITGKILQQFLSNQLVTTIDLSRYNSGVYIIKMDNGEWQKIIKY